MTSPHPRFSLHPRFSGPDGDKENLERAENLGWLG